MRKNSWMVFRVKLKSLCAWDSKFISFQVERMIQWSEITGCRRWSCNSLISSSLSKGIARRGSESFLKDSRVFFAGNYREFILSWSSNQLSGWKILLLSEKNIESNSWSIDQKIFIQKYDKNYLKTVMKRFLHVNHIWNHVMHRKSTRNEGSQNINKSIKLQLPPESLSICINSIWIHCRNANALYQYHSQ